MTSTRKNDSIESRETERLTRQNGQWQKQIHWKKESPTGMTCILSPYSFEIAFFQSSRILTHSLAIYLPHRPCLRLRPLGKAKLIIKLLPGRLLPHNVPPTPLTAQSRTRITVSSRAFFFGYFLWLDRRNHFRKWRTIEHLQTDFTTTWWMTAPLGIEARSRIKAVRLRQVL